MSKRLLIQGAGAVGEATLDQRANAPSFRLLRACVLRRVTVDMTGFREALRVEGGAAVRPLLQGCRIRWGRASTVRAVRLSPTRPP